jgi:hypothetical protein
MTIDILYNYNSIIRIPSKENSKLPFYIENSLQMSIQKQPHRTVFNVSKDVTREELQQLIRQHLANPDYIITDSDYAHWVELDKQEKEKIIALKEIAGECGRNQLQSQKKKDEINDIANFLYDADFDAKIIACDERPDFIIEMNGDKIGVELTGIFDTKVVAEINSFNGILEGATRILKQKFPTLTGMFNFTIDPSKIELKYKQQIMQECVECVVAKMTGNSIPIFNWLLSITLSEHSILKLMVSENYILSDVNIDQLIQTIQKKEHKFSAYKENTGLSIFWLLILVDGASAKSSFNIELDKLPLYLNTEYKVFIYDQMKHIIIYGKNENNR